MTVSPQVSLKNLNTFSVDVYACHVIWIYSESELLTIWQYCVQKMVTVLLLGEGSNVLFLENYNGAVLLNRIKGINVSEDENYWYLHVCSGELWKQLVFYSLERNMPGLENLAMIPGYVGSAAIQNIGAYGVEFKMFCNYVDVLNLDIKEKIRFTVDECLFNYRSSIFKCAINFNYAVVAVGLRLKKCWKPILDYDGLKNFDICKVTPWEIFYAVCAIRKKKLPDPFRFGNAGSFFKNPVIKMELVNDLLDHYPDIPIYTYKNNLVKLSAKWLIDHCYLQNHRFGSAALYENQSLVLINSNQQAAPSEIIQLALYIHKEVANRFHIFLEPEVQFIANFGEIDGKKLLSTEESIALCSNYNC